MQNALVTLAGIPCLIGGNPKATDTILLFHGWGADASDLFELSSIDPSKRWIFPRGIESVDFGGGMSGRAWFQINRDAFEDAIAGDDLGVSILKDPKGLDKARDKVLPLIQELSKGRLIIGGFSQGAMLSADCLMHTDAKCAALLFLSGGLVNKAVWETLASKRKGQRYLISHGHSDFVLPFSFAEKTWHLFAKAGWLGEMMPFAGGHEIPQKVLLAVRSLIKEVMA